MARGKPKKKMPISPIDGWLSMPVTTAPATTTNQSKNRSDISTRRFSSHQMEKTTANSRDEPIVVRKFVDICTSNTRSIATTVQNKPTSTNPGHIRGAGPATGGEVWVELVSNGSMVHPRSESRR